MSTGIVGALIGSATAAAVAVGKQIADKTGINVAAKPEEKTQPELYKAEPDNWYRSLPYAFKVYEGEKPKYFYLPINPKNITIVTHFATNVISTLYGTVEEHSEQRYFDITISGTTGFAPRFTDEYQFNGNPPLGESGGRKRYEDYSISSALGGFFPKTLGKLDQTLNKASSAIKNLTNSNTYKPGVYNNNSGYIAFHNFYTFLLNYKRKASQANRLVTKSFENTNQQSQGGDKGLLFFINFKDNNQYNCAINRFTLERSAENPMLYNYTIQMRAYNLSPIVNGIIPKESERYKQLGLDSSLSVAAKLKLSISAGKGVLSTGKSAISTLGA